MVQWSCLFFPMCCPALCNAKLRGREKKGLASQALANYTTNYRKYKRSSASRLLHTTLTPVHHLHTTPTSSQIVLETRLRSCKHRERPSTAAEYHGIRLFCGLDENERQEKVQTLENEPQQHGTF
ncbi:hypothetical protein BKA57DRAFT_437281 [Linnemannia elongata]|nr:hypothetical protein BKA57DRAFT_437281 [Linnemannia elongata]